MRAVFVPGPLARSHPAVKASASWVPIRAEVGQPTATGKRGGPGARPPGNTAGYGEDDREVIEQRGPPRRRMTGRSSSRLVRLVCFAVVFVEVAVAVGEVGGGVVVVVLPAFADAQLGPQPVKVSAAAVVLQLAGHLYLLGLGSAAPHWLDPLEHAGPCLGPCSLQ